ncbi:dynamin-like protein ARC5 [Bidens hawaiensis]|uniref:dynamin-like protein ARC5 n=1 Tax=Bidens hawaiensis TaxID=980011 RepID=UPI0040497F3F
MAGAGEIAGTGGRTGRRGRPRIVRQPLVETSSNTGDDGSAAAGNPSNNEGNPEGSVGSHGRTAEGSGLNGKKDGEREKGDSGEAGSVKFDDGKGGRDGLSLLLKGTVVAPPDKFGETLQDERVNGGALIGIDGSQFPHKLIPNAGMRLYGGAQYHHAMAEFRFVFGGIKCPLITREEIVNACEVEDIHDGTNYSRTTCVIAVAKARDTFEPFLYQKLRHLGNHLCCFICLTAPSKEQIKKVTKMVAIDS